MLVSLLRGTFPSIKVRPSAALAQLRRFPGPACHYRVSGLVQRGLSDATGIGASGQLRWASDKRFPLKARRPGQSQMFARRPAVMRNA